MLEYNQLVEDAGEEHPSRILLFRSMIELAEKIQLVQFILHKYHGRRNCRGSNCNWAPTP